VQAGASIIPRPSAAMHLGSFDAQTNHYDVIRELTAEELAQHTKFTPVVTEARSRLALFKMLNRNYVEWRRYLNRLLSPTFEEDVDVSEELNRLLLNYLTFAYSIQEHFTVSFRQRFKNNAAKLKHYAVFLEKLCKASWPFAFILDYRGYVQHVGLGITRNHRTVNDTSVKLEIVADAKMLLETRQWRRSGLKVACGEIDLVRVLKRFHIQMLQNYASFVANTFFPELKPASKFYGDLTKEVRQKNPTALMIFFAEEPQVTTDKTGKVSVNMRAIAVPNDVFNDLGIKVTNIAS
jgi:hypothetical protein